MAFIVEREGTVQKFFQLCCEIVFLVVMEYLPKDDGNYNVSLRRIMFQLSNSRCQIIKDMKDIFIHYNYEGTSSSHQGDV